MPRTSKIAAYILAFFTLGLAAYVLIGLARDLNGETCQGLWGVVESCFSVMMFPLQLVLPYALPFLIALVFFIIVPMAKGNKK